MRKCFPVLLALSICVVVHAQDRGFALIKKDPAAFIFKRNHISFSLMPGFAQKAEIHSLSGSYKPGSQPGIAIEAGFNYHINFSKLYSLTIGLHGAGAERNYTLHLPKEDFSPPQQQDLVVDVNSSRYLDMYMKLPVTVQRRWFFGKRFFEASAGTSIGFYPDDIFEEWSESIDNGSGSYIPVAKLELETTQDFKPWIDYNLGLNYGWILKHYNLLRAGLVFNYSPVSIAEGSYTIAVPGKPVSTGSYASHISYIGISASYAFTGSHQSIRRIYEREGRKVLGEFEY